MTAAKTGVIITSILNANNKPIVMNGKRTLLCFNPGIDKVLLVINKFVNETVVLTPAKTTETNKISCDPIPVNFVFDENGVINVQPAVVIVLLEHFDIKFFFLLNFNILFEKNQKVSGNLIISFHKNNLYDRFE